MKITKVVERVFGLTVASVMVGMVTINLVGHAKALVSEIDEYNALREKGE